jgi:hypothetical protein
MKESVRYSNGWFVWLVILLFIGTGCTSATPTVFDTPVVTLTSQQPQAPSFLAAVTANESKVAVLLEGESELVLQRFETVNISQGSNIQLDDNGRGVLRFGDRHEIDLLGGADVILEDAQLESGGSIFVRLKQNKGHTFVTLNEQSVARVTLETGDATITTLDPGSQFAVCYNPAAGVNCIHVNKGAVEITSQGKKQIYREGEATFFLSGEPPQAPFCIEPEAFDAWLVEKRGSVDPGPLSELVQNSPPGPCGTPIAEPANVDEPTSTPTPTATATTPLTLTTTPTRTLAPPPPASPTPTKKPRETEPEDEEEDPTEPAPTEEDPTEEPPTEEPTEIPPPPWQPTDTSPPPTDIPPDPTEPPSTPAP